MGVSEHWFSRRDLRRVRRAEEREWTGPVPTQQVSNGEYLPAPQSRQQKEVEARLAARAERTGRHLGIGRRAFLKSASGMAAAFLAMNEVYGRLFDVDPAEAAQPERAQARLKALQGQFIFDDQTHHVADRYGYSGIARLLDYAGGANPSGKVLNPALAGRKHSIEEMRFRAYVKDIFLDSETTVCVLSSFTSDDPERIALTNEEMVASRDTVNRLSGTKRLFSHGLAWPSHPGNLEQMERAATELKIDSWKSYTVGDPLRASQYPWRLDDETVAYPAYALADRHGIRNWCCHKGLIPGDYRKFRNWQYADVRDLGRACRDWPQLNFIIYHAAMRPAFHYEELQRMLETSGAIPWVDDLAAIRGKFGVDNVYADLGSTFGTTAITHPRLCAAMLARLIAGCGYDHVCWGTDSVWYGSPQWQIEAFRRIQIPEDIARQAGLSEAEREDFNAHPDGRIKSAILGLNSARLYGLSLPGRKLAGPDPASDGLARLKAEYLRAGTERDDLFHGWIRRERGA